jgi:nitrogen fixation protein
MSDIIDINVGETIEEVTINVVDNVIQVNINKITGSGAVDSVNGQTGVVSLGLQEVTDEGNETTNDVIVKSSTTDSKITLSLIDDIEPQIEVDYVEDGSHYKSVIVGGYIGVTGGSSNNYLSTDWLWMQNDAAPQYKTVLGAGDLRIGDQNSTDGLNSQIAINKIVFRKGNANRHEINYTDPTDARTHTLQDTSGIIAHLSDIPTVDTSTLVPYTGATTNVDLGEFELKAGQIELDTTPTGTAGVAVTRWNDTLGSSETTLKGGSVILKNGVDLVARVVNKVSPNTTLTKAAYQVVKVSGAQGQRLAVNLAQANNDNNSADTLGIVCETISTNQEGFIITVGQLEGINTTGSLQSETWEDGDVLYLSPTTAGRITNIKPTGATGHIVILGYVEYAHSVNGKIYVKIMNGWELDELHNVFIDTPLNNQALTYESSTDLWKNKTIIQDSVTYGVTTIAPSQNAVFDALALKQTDLFEFNTKQGFYLFEDFLGNPASSSFNSYGISTFTSGTGAVCIPNTTYPNRTNQQGVMLLATGTTATGSANIRIGENNATSHYLGNGIYTMQYFVNIETLSDATNRFFSIIGSNTNANFSNTNGIFFLYDEGIGTYGAASPNWKCITRNSTITATITSTVVTASQWYVLKIVVNANASSVQFFIDNTLVATHTTNIPTLITPRIAHVKTVGTTNRNLFCDYMLFQQIYTTPRTI